MPIESQGIGLFWSTTTSLSTASQCAIGGVQSFSGPSGSAGVIDITSLGSTAKEKMIGLRDEGQLSFEVNLLTSSSGQNHLREDRASRSKRRFTIDLHDDSTTKINGEAYCTGFSISGGVDNVVKGSIQLEITGPVLYTTA